MSHHKSGYRHRTAPLLAGAACLAALAAGCGSAATTASPVSVVARRHLEQDVLDVMDRNGLPVMDSYISCKARPNGHTDTCYGQTDEATANEIEGDFNVSSTNATSHSCPGSLSVKVALHLLQKVEVDPCR